MMQLGNSPLRVLIGNLATAWKAAGTTISSYTDLSDGQMAHVSPNNVTLNPATAITSATGPTRIVVRNGNKLVYSDWISQAAADASSVLSVTKAYAADTQQVYYIGYNGTSGSLDVASQNEYIVNIRIKDDDVTFHQYPYMKHGTYLSDSTATGVEIGIGLVGSLVKNFSRESLQKIQFDMICSHAYTAGNLLDHNATVVKGSKNITVATNLTYAATTATLTVGDYLRLGAVGVSPTVASNVYKVIAINSLVVTLDRPVTDASGTYLTATPDIEVIPAADAVLSTNLVGIKCTAIAHTNFVPGEQKHFLTKFDIELSKGWENTEVTKTTEASFGTGTYEEVAEMEWLAQGNEGKFVTLGVPMFKSRNAADETKFYTRTIYTYVEPGENGIVIGTPSKTKTLYIYTAQTDASTPGQANTDVAAVL